MQTMAIQIKDNYLQNFMNYVNNHSENGTMEMLSQEQYDNEMEIFFRDLKANANL